MNLETDTGKGNLQEPIVVNSTSDTPKSLTKPELLKIAEWVLSDMNKRSQLGWGAYLHTARSAEDVAALAVSHLIHARKVDTDLKTLKGAFRDLFGAMLTTHGELSQEQE